MNSIIPILSRSLYTSSWSSYDRGLTKELLTFNELSCKIIENEEICKIHFLFIKMIFKYHFKNV